MSAQMQLFKIEPTVIAPTRRYETAAGLVVDTEEMLFARAISQHSRRRAPYVRSPRDTTRRPRRCSTTPHRPDSFGLGRRRAHQSETATAVTWRQPGSIRSKRPEWVRELRDVCREQRVPFFFKQWGGIRSKTGGRDLDGKLYAANAARSSGLSRPNLGPDSERRGTVLTWRRGARPAPAGS